MTLVFQTNTLPTTGADAIFQFKEFLKSALSWTVIQSSDGTTVYSGDGLFSSNTGPHGLQNDRAWFTIQVNSSTRQFSFQHINTPPANNRDWRMKYSFAGFDTPNHVNPQFATPHSSSGDDQVIFGGGTDDFPTFATLFHRDATYTLQMGGDTSSNAAFFFCHTNESTVPFSTFVFDALAASSFDPGDIDPYVMYISGNTTFTFSPTEMNDTNALNCPRGWIAKGFGGEGFVKVPALVLANNDSGTVVPANLGSNPYALEDQFFPIVYARPILSPPAPPYGYKGVSSLMQWCSAQRPKVALIGINSSGDHVQVNNLVLPWNNTALLI